MGHELDWREAGLAAVYTVGETAWHREGRNLIKAPSLDEGIVEAGQEFEAEKFPLFVKIPTAGGDFYEVEVPDNFAVVRLDRPTKEGVLGVVGSSYEVLQNRAAFGVLEPLLDAGVASLETGGTLRGGRDVWQLIRFNIADPTVQAVFGKLGVIPFGLISNNHNGTRMVNLRLTPVRVVCANTLSLAHKEKAGRGVSEAIMVPHRKNVKSATVAAAQKLFIEFTSRMRVVAEQYEALAATALSEEQFARAVLDVIAPLPKKPEGPQKNQIAQKAYERALVRAEAKRNRVTFLRDNGIGHTGDGSAWEAYQAVTQSMDHDVDIWKVGGESRAQALFDGTLGITKQKALDAIYQEVMRSSKADLAVTA